MPNTDESVDEDKTPKEILTRLVMTKLRQDSNFKTTLIDTGMKTLIEANKHALSYDSADDLYDWSLFQKQRTGKNLLG